ncbi:MAG: hypothetical protein ACRDJN_03890 [Chloroflexota bacterium]
MPLGVRKLALTVHLTVSVGWIGAVVAYLALAVAAATSLDAQTVRAAWIAMELTGWWAIVPLALAALLTGLVLALGTPWGLFRHYWVLISLALTMLCTVILLLHMPTVNALAQRGPRGGRCRPQRAGGRSVSPWRWPGGAARDHGAQCVQAAGPDPLRVA